jgi:hypothetical protein
MPFAVLALVAALVFRVIPTKLAKIAEPAVRGWIRRWLAVASVFFGVVSVTILFTTWREYSSLTSALTQGKTRSVEGRVTQFIPEGPDGHPIERFSVEGKAFEYSSYMVTSGFHRVARLGGPIHEGVNVRITYVDGSIVRLQVEQ